MKPGTLPAYTREEVQTIAIDGWFEAWRTYTFSCATNSEGQPDEDSFRAGWGAAIDYMSELLEEELESNDGD